MYVAMDTNSNGTTTTPPTIMSACRSSYHTAPTMIQPHTPTMAIGAQTVAHSSTTVAPTATIEIIQVELGIEKTGCRCSRERAQIGGHRRRTVAMFIITCDHIRPITHLILLNIMTLMLLLMWIHHVIMLVLKMRMSTL